MVNAYFVPSQWQLFTCIKQEGFCFSLLLIIQSCLGSKSVAQVKPFLMFLYMLCGPRVLKENYWIKGCLSNRISNQKSS